MSQPNILFIQVDQMSAAALPAFGNSFSIAPNLDRLCGEGLVYENAYCNYPICAPSRFSMMTGQLPSQIDAFDNAAELPAGIPTFAHYLRAEGYQTSLVGKMHFVGPDQLHGFEDRLTAELYPTDFGWNKVGTAFSRASRSPTTGASLHVGADPEQRRRSNTTNWSPTTPRRKLYDLARGGDDRPFLMVSLLHPSLTNPTSAARSTGTSMRIVEHSAARGAPDPLADADGPLEPPGFRRDLGSLS